MLGLTRLELERMKSALSKSHSVRNLVLCISTSFILFLISSAQVLNYLLADKFLPRNSQLGMLSLELAIVTTIVTSLIAVPLGYGYMFFFGGVVSTRAIKFYLYMFRGKTVIASKAVDLEDIAKGKGYNLMLRRQLIYFGFILAVVVSFAIYLSRHGIFPIVSPLSKTSDVISLITQDYITLTMSGSLMLPVVALALPYFGGLRLRTIDVGPFHTSLLSFVVGASGGFTLLYSLLARPIVSLLVYYLLLFMGVCWCFSLGCNLAADPANRQIVRDVLSEKKSSTLLSSKIWLENPPGKFVEV
jgi:hypothetical protein